jgi:hypothetical protein
MSDNQVLRINNKQYPVAELSEEIRMLVGYHNIWTNDLNKQRLEVIKTETALRECIRELRGEIAKGEANGEIVSIEDREVQPAEFAEVTS